MMQQMTPVINAENGCHLFYLTVENTVTALVLKKQDLSQQDPVVLRQIMPFENSFSHKHGFEHPDILDLFCRSGFEIPV